MELQREECNILKGMAIMAIITHNYCHWLPMAPAENEYWWSLERFQYFLSTFLSKDFLIYFFSFWGHYGVPIFVFISGYGLVKKYEQTNITISKNFYIYNHTKKLVKLMIPGLLMYFLTSQVLHFNYNKDILLIVLAQITFFANLIPSKYLSIEPGPYWYFGLTLQLYIIYILFVYKRHWRYLLAICIFSVIALCFFVCHPGGTVWLKYNFIGSILPFAFGIILSRHERSINLKKSHFLYLLLLSLILIPIFEMNYFSWIFNPTVIVIMTICLSKTIHSYLTKTFAYLGKISNIIFVIHPTIRICFYYKQDHIEKDPYCFLILYIMIVIATSIIFSVIIKYYLKRFRT